MVCLQMESGVLQPSSRLWQWITFAKSFSKAALRSWHVFARARSAATAITLKLDALSSLLAPPSVLPT